MYPLIEQRDETSGQIATRAAELHSTLTELARVRADAMVATRRNVELAAQVLELAERRHAPARGRRRGKIRPRRGGRSQEGPDGDVDMDSGDESEDDSDEDEDDDEKELARSVTRSRRIWKTRKGVASAVVAGSGVDWAADPVLREIVLDPEE